ncbi:pseudouridine synthase [Pelagicoccus sp. SDUM812003]|uniref:pseudouridine synthase n=1 Tax=Pelagicoccus sp. SDUM812003 TaxID=3041267 RepID=UPI002810761F|nr:pseudouridine synthase [Pelagicoccus sp. SDUM812003]MDQ8201656.1 pseudouridine synthase [Pelagicoccus sp. SDUM812003]
MSQKSAFISFPPGYLGSQPMKFPLLANDERLFAVSKPAGVSCYQHEWTLGKPDFSMALRRELLNGKPQLERLGVKGVFRVYNLDAELSGALVFAKDEENEGLLKNAAGSDQLRFRFHLLARAETEEREFACDLPIARHFHDRRMLVSHKTGKRSETRFRFLRPFGQYQLWEAECTEMRLHQVRLHAAECGLMVVGEELYSDGGQVYLSRLKRGYLPSKGRERPIYPHLCVHLVEVGFSLPGLDLEPVMAPLPSRFETLLKRLDEHRGSRG